MRTNSNHNDSRTVSPAGKASPPVLVEDKDQVTHLRLNRPDAHNALDRALLEALGAALNHVRCRSQTRVVVLSGVGLDFCTGGDVPELEEAMNRDDTGDHLRHLFGLGHMVCKGLAAAEPVTIARLNGRVFGAGMALALHCDIRIGTDEATFRLPELALGVPPVWGGSIGRFLHEMGAARLRELLLFGESVDAATANAYGIIHRSVADEEELDRLLDQWSRRLAQRNAGATRIAKRVLSASESTSQLGDISLLEDDLFQIGARHLWKQHPTPTTL